ncbi:hypothetical protein D3C71_1304260 [compost metagenome]
MLNLIGKNRSLHLFACSSLWGFMISYLWLVYGYANSFWYQLILILLEVVVWYITYTSCMKTKNKSYDEKDYETHVMLVTGILKGMFVLSAIGALSGIVLSQTVASLAD